jgi:hypothetical protein
VSVNETKAETKIVIDKVIANSRNSLPMMPPMRRSGIRTAISEMLIETMVNATSREPFKAAARGSSPASI